MDLNSNRPVNRSEPVARKLLNLFEFRFEFNRFPPVTGPTGPVNRNRWPAVWVNRLGKKTLAGTGMAGGTAEDEVDCRAGTGLVSVRDGVPVLF